MKTNIPDFTPQQWEFLAVLKVFSELTPITLVGALVPLSPVPLFTMLRQCKELGWLQQTEDDKLILTSDLPPEIAKKLKKINSSAHIENILSQLESKGLLEQVNIDTRSSLLSLAGRYEESARLELEVIFQELKTGELKLTPAELNPKIKEFSSALSDSKNKAWFISTALEFSNFCYAKGSGQLISKALLESSIEMADQIGDQRSWAMIKFHIGRILMWTNQRNEALESFKEGISKVNDLGDQDIIIQSSEFLGYYHYIQGLYAEALRHFETAVNNSPYESCPLAPVFLGLCEYLTGKIDRAIGTFDYYWNVAQRHKNATHAATFKALLGCMLLMIGKINEALFYINSAYQEAMVNNNSIAIFYCLMAKSNIYYQRDEWKEAIQITEELMELAKSDGLISPWAPPISLRHIYLSEKYSYNIPGMSKFEEQFECIMNGPNVHLKGIALRLRAFRAMTIGQNKKQIFEDLEASEKYLKQSGDTIALSETWLVMARFKIREGKIEEGHELIQAARKELSIYWEQFIPDDLKFFIKGSYVQDDNYSEIFESIFETIEELSPLPLTDEAFTIMLSKLSQFFKAERACLFIFDENSDTSPSLRATQNLSQKIVFGDSFSSNLFYVFQCFRESKPQIIENLNSKRKNLYSNALSILCLPVSIDKKRTGILYFDNSYIENCFSFVTQPLLVKISHYLNRYFVKILEFERVINEANQAALKKTTQLNIKTTGFFSHSPEMAELSKRHARMANSEANLLILGETGVGKEYMAQWIHENSPYHEGPFIVVDPNIIPESLMESELFGHEKGAFTGADRQKVGRVELAHRGTLFVDEIGELPLAIQPKLLRLLQEKTFVRVGGVKTIKSDFRLIAATNRDLAKLVEEGKFREDLYYRLNVLQIVVPPLRRRKRDLVALANHFIKLFSRKYNRSSFRLTPENENFLTRYHWPGNIRELKSIIERAVLISGEGELDFNLVLQSDAQQIDPFADNPTLDEIQRRYINYVLHKTGGQVGGRNGAAEILGMKRTTLQARMKKLGLV